MAKDPAVLFYTSDFLSGTSFFTDEQKGQYITLLCQQHQLYSIPENHMIFVCKSLDSPVVGKFLKDHDGKYYNARMREEGIKRANYCASRGNNKSGRPSKEIIRKSYDNHMENENVDENKDLIAAKDDVFNTSEAFEKIWAVYPVKDGKKAAKRSFLASVKTMGDFTEINAALANYRKSEKVLKGFIKNGSTWFANWQDWKTYVPPAPVAPKQPPEVIALTCVAQGLNDQQIKAEIMAKGHSEHIAVEAVMRARGKVE